MRRALADARWKAVAVDRLFVAAPIAPTAEAARRFARRALGPHGAEIPAIGLVIAGEQAESIASGAARAAQRLPAGDWELAVCVGLGPDGTAVALCLSRRAGQ